MITHDDTLLTSLIGKLTRIHKMRKYFFTKKTRRIGKSFSTEPKLIFLLRKINLHQMLRNHIIIYHLNLLLRPS